MKRSKLSVLSLLAAGALCASMLCAPAAAAAAGDVQVWSSTIGGHSAKVMSVPMPAGRTGQVSLANNSVVDAVGAQTLIDNVNAQPGTHVVAAMNGGFFNSYTSGTPVFPNSCPAIMDAVITGGKLVHTGRSSVIGFAADGKPMVDWVTFKASVKLGNGFTPGCWSVNTYESDPEAIMLFDEHLTLPVTIPASSTMFYIQNGVITSAVPGSTITVPAGTYVLVYNAGITSVENGYHRLPQAGMSAEVTFSASGTDRDETWNGVQEALTGGPVLVKNGANVVDDQRNSVYYGDPKQRPDAVLARTFIGVTGSGSLVMGTVSASFRQIADWMVANGVQEGLAMDGGGSCMLYANEAFQSRPGRNLASVLTIVDRTGGQVTPPPAVNTDEPSAWAAPEIQTAIAEGLVPAALQSDYRKDISRQDFCILIWELIKQQPNYMELLWNKPEVTFSDTDVAEVSWCAQLNIISGVGEGRFDPHRNLKRSEAAKILALTTQLLKNEDGTLSATPPVFSDRDTFGWAQPFIDYCAANDIMKGEGDAFGPNGTFSREQAMATILRISQRYGR